ncbi:MAG: aminomethyl-transferring glycine dehydrogenase subunit GcvPB [Chloroflexi bacterium]|nr:aminomethyl-transferring glycine dehydrogenase subunit GcvPB [Chloroflexota bacterium]MCI0775161.1 aminomethyl-transferring glycine dehydrogenase subunit GcvPB [Chloroflexota bacterium]
MTIGPDIERAGDIDRRLLMDRSVAGRRAFTLPESDVPVQELPDPSLLRDDIELPEVSQLEVIRYFSLLSQLNFSIDTNFYPLGSCTMKYNPKINDELANLPGLADIHPLQPAETVQGAIRLLKELQDDLGEITGLPGVSLAPLAGAQGEYAGLLIARAYHQARHDAERTVAIIPDSAHGTNPASASMAGLEVVTVRSDDQGNVDVENLRELADSRTAAFMLTIPSTLGLFEPNILEITKIIHDAGGLVYADGANLNALLGLVKLGDLGVDICHSNLHKTFSTPHGGGGPGSGPVLVRADLARYLPEPVAEKTGDGPDSTYRLAAPADSIGPLNGFHGSFSIAARAYAYIRALGIEGLRSVSENAIIGANYIQAGLKDRYDLAADRYCMHETVLSATRQKKRGVSGLDIAKRLLDFGIHAPTMYFPLIVEEALMIEPTESESKETLDHFIAVMRQIDDEVDSAPELIHDAPHDLPVTRLDEATAARRPVLRWSAE